MRVGILSLQGAVQPHRRKLEALGARVVLVRTADELMSCAGVVLPGGESTTMLKLLHDYGLTEPLQRFAQTAPVWGVCAGSILMAEHVENPSQASFGFLPITVRRNAYGRQNESFIATVELHLPERPVCTQEAVFIRAPRIVAYGEGVRVLAEHDGTAIALTDGRHLTTTFHPELSAPETLHAYFLSLCEGEAGLQAQAGG